MLRADCASPLPHAPWAYSHEPAFREGARHMVEVALGIGAWGLVTGVAMVNSGLSVPLALAMTLLVFSGSAQLAALPMLAVHAPLWLILATAACVNLRFVIFSAAWRPYFGHLPRAQRMLLGYFTADLNYVLFMRRFPQPQPAGRTELAYFWGGVACNWGAWQLMSILGILLATRVPPQWDLGFAGTLALLGVCCSLLMGVAAWAAAAAAALASVLGAGLPMRLNIVLAIVSAVVVGVAVDRFTHRRARSA